VGPKETIFDSTNPLGLFSSLINNNNHALGGKNSFSVPPPQIAGRKFRPSFGLINFANNGHLEFLEHFARNLNQEVLAEKVDPVIGREEETENLIRILMRKFKNNPVLVGDPGVGKTALISALASKIINREVPPALSNCVIYSLDLGLLVAGTTFRGEFEERFKNVIEEAEKNPNVILFIDEIHNLIGAGSAQGSLDAANIMKPALARGLIRCIGATTSEEYHKYVEKDGALERRFQPIWVKEPSLKKTELILEGVKKYYEKFHRVKIAPEAIKKAVFLANRFIPDRFMPDKALDLIDETASFVVMDEYRKSSAKQFQRLTLQKEKIEKMKNRIVQNNDLDLAEALLKNERDLKLLMDRVAKKVKQEKKFLPIVSEKDVITILAKKLNLPPELLAETTDERVDRLPQALKEKIKGQNEAVKTIVSTLKRSLTGIADPLRPSVSLLFVGPTGVGKTYLAKVLAKEIFLRSDALIRVDMSEFGEKHTASKLLGSPPGYVGYGERSDFMEKVRKNPYSLLLFDEIEKAHPEIFNLFLQILEDGHLTDATGKKINFKNTLIVFTSNLIGSEFTKKTLGFGGKKGSLKKQTIPETVIRRRLEEFLKPEFINRLTEIIPFNPLGKKELKAIAKLEIEKLQKRLRKKKNLILEVDPKTEEWLANKSLDNKEGVRLLRKSIQRDLEEKIAAYLTSKKIKKNSLQVTVSEQQIKVS